MISTWLRMSSEDDDTIYTCTPRVSCPSNDVDSTSPHTRGHRRAAGRRGFGPFTQIFRMSCKARAMASMKASVEVSLHDFFDSIPNFISSRPAVS